MLSLALSFSFIIRVYTPPVLTITEEILGANFVRNFICFVIWSPKPLIKGWLYLQPEALVIEPQERGTRTATLASSPLNEPKERLMQTKGSLEEAGHTENTYSSEATTLVTSGIGNSGRLRTTITIGRPLMRMGQDKERETLTTFINLFMLLQIYWEKTNPHHFF